MKVFAAISQAAIAPQALDTKTKGHIALAMALRCDDRIAFHVKAARRLSVVRPRGQAR
ncbi:MAG: carboxymuconolactone decarboxylase family protein [Methyloceanibacter sp.]